MIEAKIIVEGLNKPEVANKFLMWLQNAYTRETRRASHNIYDRRHWKVIKGWKKDDLARKNKIKLLAEGGTKKP